MCANSRCINTLGSYRCICNKGYEHPPDGNQIKCQDIDECSRPSLSSRDAGPCDQECKNTEGSFRCSCRKGFRLEADGVSCRGKFYVKCGPTSTLITIYLDIDECSIGRHDCQHNCVNVPGSFECSCRVGYEKSGKGTCVDVDECTKDPSICSPLGTCKNTPGSYKCVCPRGYTPDGDGTSCYGKISVCTSLKIASFKTLVNRGNRYGRMRDGWCKMRSGLRKLARNLSMHVP